MKLAMLAIAGMAVASAAIAAENTTPLLPEGDDRVPELATDEERNCEATIESVRAERGLPRIERGPSQGDEAILYKAVDHEIEGCDVLLVADGSVRPVPVPDKGAPLLKPAQ